jgi:hypothetical protein
MNGVESSGSTNYVDPVLRVMATSKEQSTIREEGRPTGGPAGMDGALKLSGDFVKQAMTEIGFVNIQAGGTESIEAFVRLADAQNDSAEAALEPAAAAELAVQVATQMGGEANLALRIMARLDPARSAVLLR